MGESVRADALTPALSHREREKTSALFKIAIGRLAPSERGLG